MQFIRIGSRVINLDDISLVELSQQYTAANGELIDSVVMTTIRGESISFDNPVEADALRRYCSNVEDIVSIAQY